MSDVAAGKLLTSNDIRELCAQLNIRPTKTLGQNFVNDPGTVRKIVRNAGVQAGEQVLEIGPGLGSLTLALLEAGAQVSAVEIDPPWPKLCRPPPRPASRKLNYKFLLLTP